MLKDMASEGKEKKRKAIVLPNDALAKPQKKSKKSLENKNDDAISVQLVEVVTKNGSEAGNKSKHKPRKRTADFLSDTEDNPTDGTSAQVPARGDADAAGNSKRKKTGEGAASIKDKAENVIDTQLEAPSKKSKKSTKTRGKHAADAETPTADGANDLEENLDDEELDQLTNKDAKPISMQVEGKVTAEKEIEDEWGSEDEEEDQGAALLAGFDSDGEDNAEDVGLEAGKPLPKLSKKASKEVKKATQKDGSEGPGAVYVGRIPHGFYEHQMREYFSQFGTITKLRLSRNRRTGASKHFAFIEFESDEVAKIVANAMDNYLMFGHILKCKYAPQDSLHPGLWKGANKRFKKVPYTMLEKKALEAPKTSKQWEKKNAREQKKREQKAEKLRELGYEIKLPMLKDPKEILERRQLQNTQQKKALETAQEAQDTPAGAIEPPSGLLKDDVALKVEKKSKKNKPDEQQPMETPAKVAVASQPAKPAAEEAQSETQKREKRKEKKTKLDSQPFDNTKTTIEGADSAAKSAKSTTVGAESTRDNKDDETTTVDPLANDNEKKRKRRKIKHPKVGKVETAAPVATKAAKTEASTEKPKKKKPKSESDVELKGAKKSSNAV